jgi:leader peptidase (prepilin peptidase) / N-methyltransferase
MGGLLTIDGQGTYLVIVAVFGLLFGSFLSVCIYRIPRDLSVVSPRSFCVQCRKQIFWHDNIPLLSYVLLDGKCRFCRTAIGIRYPIVELTTAALFVLVALQYGWTLAALKWGVFEAIMIVLFWTDLEERILPDELTLGGTLVGLIFAVLVPVYGVFGASLLPGARPVWRSFLNIGLGVTALVGSMWLLAIVYARVRRREGLGGGDLKLLLLLAVFLGLEKAVLAVLIGSIGGSLIGVLYIWLTHKKAGSFELPFGSFLCAGAAIVPLLTR